VSGDDGRLTGDARTAALMLGDDALICAQRLAEWAGHAPVLEEDVALANIALDLLGQARALLSLAGDEDELAFLREEREFRNVQLAEQPNGDFAHTIARQLYFSTAQELLYTALATAERCPRPIRELAAKAVKETAYHRDHATEWTLRLGDGTAESHRRMQDALDQALCYGWIDTKGMRIDDERWKVRFVSRRPNSNWSERNITRVKELTVDGLMAEPGLRAFERRPSAST
jgi:ring-1,2-phenylacetyl-CoA epoxidase subunit PaaC